MKALSLAARTMLALLAISLCPALQATAQQGSGFKYLEVKVVDPEGKPVSDASVEVTMDNVTFPMPTDDKGMISLNVPSGPNASLQLKVQKEGFAAVNGTWGAGQEIPTEIEISLEPGIEIGGIVHDEHGNPVEGVTVEAQASNILDIGVLSISGAKGTLSGQLAVTNAEGQWRYGGASEANQKVTQHLHLSHPDYANDNNSHPVTFEQLRAMDHALVLKKGIELRGTVTDPDDNPVAGAKVALGSDLGQKDQIKTTDAEGKYLSGNLPPGQTVMTVYSPDFAPQLRVVMAQKDMAAVDFQLQKGVPMRIRVTDPDGKPIQGVGVVADTWLGYRTLYQLGQPERTDENGLCIWENAPAEEMSYDFWHDSHMSLRNQLLTAGDEPHEIVLERPITVTGDVVDAATGLPIELFNAVQGMRFDPRNTDVYWERYNMQAGRDGKFEMRFTEPRGGHFVRIEARGYKPAVSREIHDDEGEVSLEFQLEPGTGPSGIIKRPDGSPAAGAEVIIASTGGQIYLQNGMNQQQDESARVVADEEGKYQLPFPDSDYVVVFLHDDGWAQFDGASLEASPDVALNMWARLEGTVKIADHVATNERVNLNFMESNVNRSNGPNVYWSYNGQTDAEGAFVIERLKSGDASVGRLITFGVGQMQMSTFSHSVPVLLSAGKTTQVQIGGAGRQVKGKIVLPDDYDGPNPWAMGQVQFYEQPSAVTGVGSLFFELGKALAKSNTLNPVQLAQAAQPVPRRSYAAAINEDGGFQIDDVLPGSYAVNVVVYEPPAGQRMAWNMLGTANGNVTVPEDGEGPVDAGEFKLMLQPRQPATGVTGTFRLQVAPAPVQEAE